MTKLASEKVIIEAPTSFSGSAKRIFKIMDYADNIENEGVRAISKVFLWWVALSLTLLAWTFVAIWYFVIFGVFGLLVVPFRLFTRGKRKRKVEALRHREVMDALSKK